MGLCVLIQGRAQEFCQGGQRLARSANGWGVGGGFGGRSPPRGLQRGVRGASPGKILKFNPLNYAFNGTFSMNFQKNEVNS